MLRSEQYSFRPHIDDEIKRQHFSTTELLRKGTSIDENDKVVLLHVSRQEQVKRSSNNQEYTNSVKSTKERDKETFAKATVNFKNKIKVSKRTADTLYEGNASLSATDSILSSNVKHERNPKLPHKRRASSPPFLDNRALRVQPLKNRLKDSEESVVSIHVEQANRNEERNTTS